VHIDLEPSKEFYKLLARGFKPTSHAKIKLDRRNRRVIFHLSLEKEIEIYRPEKAVKPVDVDENSLATLYEAFSIIQKQILQRRHWAIAIGRRVSRGEMDPIAERLGRLWKSLRRERRKRTIG
jgi:transposase